MKLIALASLLVLPACGLSYGGNETPALPPQPTLGAVRCLISPQLPSEAVESILAATAAWHEASGNRFTCAVTLSEDADVGVPEHTAENTFLFRLAPADTGADIAAEAEWWQGHLSAVVWLRPLGARETMATYNVTTTHEVGHALGLNHPDDATDSTGFNTPSIMRYWGEEDAPAITPYDVAAFDALWTR